MHPAASLALASLLLLLSPSLAMAEQPAQGKNAAREHARQGSRLFDEGKYSEAIQQFEKAYAAQPHYLVQCNIARCHELLNVHDKAADHYRRCLKEGAEKSPQADQVREALAGVEKKLEAQRQEAATQQATPPPVSPPAPTSTPPRPFWTVLGLGAAIQLKDLPSQLKLRVAGGYHFWKGLTGPNLGLDVQIGVAGGFQSIELAPLFSWDFAIAPQHGFYVAPAAALGLAHVTTVCVKGERLCGSRTGVTFQLAGELKLVLAGRALLIFRPIGLDIVATSGERWLTSVRYDLLMSGGAVF